jgi:4-carboxymuconolactone decarboxylase
MTDTPPSIPARGEATRRRVLGDAHVNRSMGNATPFDAPFVSLITEAAWGHVWGRGTLPLRERSMVTLALLAGLGNDEEFKLHLRATVNTGATPQDVAEVLLHVAIYAGVPRANHAMKLARETYADLGISLTEGAQ